MVWKSQTIDVVSSASIVQCRLSKQRGPAGYPAGLLYCNVERMAKYMKQGKTLQALGEELQRQRAVRKDFLADTRSLQMTTNGNASLLYMTVGKEQKEFKVGELAHQQIASRLQIPYRYYQKMQREFPDLLDENVNGWFDQNPERRMIRTLDGHIRAFLSDRYRRLDNLELCAAVLPVIQDMKGASIESCDVTEIGDVVQAGFVISNSEVGLGSLRVEPLVFRLVCKNGLICKDYSQKRYHVRRQAMASGEDAYELYSDETLRQDDKAFFMKVQDTVRCAVDEAKFMLTVDAMKRAMHIPLEHDPVKEVEVLADRFPLNQGERGNILRQLFLGKDLSRYGLVNAVTAASKFCDSYERATDLERMGGELLALPIPKTALPVAPPIAYRKNNPAMTPMQALP